MKNLYPSCASTCKICSAHVVRVQELKKYCIDEMSERKNANAMVFCNKQIRHLSGKGAVKVLVGNTHRKYFHFVIVGRGKKAGLRCYLNHFHYLAPLTFIHTVSTAVGQVIWAGQV